MQKTKTPTQASESVSVDTAVIPVEEQTTLRVSKELHEKLSLISAFEDRTIISITQAVLGDYCRRYESATGRSLTRSKSKAPLK